MLKAECRTSNAQLPTLNVQSWTLDVGSFPIFARSWSQCASNLGGRGSPRTIGSPTGLGVRALLRRCCDLTQSQSGAAAHALQDASRTCRRSGSCPNKLFMSNPTPNDPKPASQSDDRDELAPVDDAIIARAFRRSVIVVVLV